MNAQRIQLPWGLMVFVSVICFISLAHTLKFVQLFSKDILSVAMADTLPAAKLSSTCPLVDTSVALSCLSQTTKDLKLAYPDDAVQHFRSIHAALERWTNTSKMHCAAKYCGPWIENHWISHFRNSTNGCLSETFGPYVPLLIPWVDIWLKKKFKYPKEFVEILIENLRPDVPYITVSQNDQGLTGNNEFQLPSNVLVLSAGGHGHVPIPLLKQEEPLSPPSNEKSRQYLISYVGSLDHAPKEMRRHMHEYLLTNVGDTNYTHYYGKKQRMWRDIMQDSYINLAPRGFGRTSYHIMETLQMGRIPIHVYLDVPWVPYRAFFENQVGYITTVEELPSLLDKIRGMTTEQFHQKEALIASYRESHFTIGGILKQIQLFMIQGIGDLECVPLPKSVRGDD